MPKNLLLVSMLVALLCAPFAARADEATRAVQEELRKRKIYFGDVDGRQTPSVLDAVKKYQERKGFAATGEPDSDTLRSLGISAPASREPLPDVPVLRSDKNMTAAPVVTNTPAATPARPTDAPPPTRTEMVAWVRQYLDACMTPDVNDELAYYADQVDYFHYGTVRKEDIGRELSTYLQQWPTRRYWISGPVSLDTTGANPVVRSRITFELENGGRHATGKVDNSFIVARRADMTWEIIAHAEERVRQTATRRRGSRKRQPAMSPVERTLRKFFGTEKKRKRR